MRYLAAIVILFISTCLMAQQRPFVNNISKTSGTVGETVTITGSGFSGNMQVNFGAGVATISSSSPTLLEVVVPASATYGPVVVTDLNTRLSGSSSIAFTPSFSGGAFDQTAVDTEKTFDTDEQFTYDLCACDFNGDELIDVAVSNNNNSSEIVNVFINASTTSEISFTPREDLNNEYPTVNTECGDLNGDGLPELVFTTEDGSNASHVFIYRNTSSGGNISFTKTQFRLPTRQNGTNRNPRQFKIADVDSDGKNDLIVGNLSDNVLHIYRNTSSGAPITFASPVQVAVSGSSNVGGLAAGDLNNDELPDLAVIAFNIVGGIYILENESSPGEIKFTQQGVVDNSSNRVNIIIADFNGDQKKDLATTSVFNDEVDIFENTSSGNSITFNANTLSISSNINNPWGAEAADVNGDGLPDINVASTMGGMLILENTSSGGSFDFDVKTIASGSSYRNITIFDANGDAKPDFAATNSGGENALGQVAVIGNQNCVVPEIGPDGLTFCAGSPFIVSATKTAGATYDWEVTSGDATIVPAGDEATVTVNTGTEVEIKVTISSDDESCAGETIKAFNLTGGTPPAAPTFTPDEPGPYCSGDSFTLTAGDTGQDEYFWTLPDGSVTITSIPSLTVDEITSTDAGNYLLRVQQDGSCISEISNPVSVEINEPPAVSVHNNGEDNFCEGTTVELQVPDYEGFTYQWRRDNSDITGADQATYNADVTGDYSVVVISGDGCENESAVYPVEEVAPPQSSITAVDEKCADVPVEFTAQAVNDPDFTASYSWDFGDGTASETGREPESHSFSGPQSEQNADTTYNVTLTVAWNEISQCSRDIVHSITVSTPPDLTITAENDLLEKCPNDSVKLDLPAGYDAYYWLVNNDTVSTAASAYITTGPEEDQVDVTASVTTAIGCEVTDIPPVTVSNFANSRIELSSPEAEIEDNEINLESGVSTVVLEAANGSNYEWEPADIMRVGGTGESATVYPQNRETLVSVTGTDAINGCETTASVTIITPGVIPRKSFSPNGDGQGYDCWEILNTNNLEGCTVYVFDQRGRYVFQGDSPFDGNCVWNGNIDNGSSPAPEGIYYFVMKCDNSDFNHTGTILLGR